MTGKVKLISAGGGSVSLATPSTGSNRTVTLPDADLTIPATNSSGTLTTQGDILYRDGSGIQRLPKGTGSQTLKMNSGATAPEWVTVAAAASPKIVQYKVAKKVNTASSTSSSQVEISSDFRTTLTPTASDSIIVVTAYLYITISDANALSFRIVRNTASDFSGTSTRVLDPTSLASEDDGIATEYVNASGHMSPVVITAYETSSNTTARTYSPFWRAGGGTMVMGQWGSGEYLGVSTMTVMEVTA